MKLELKHLAPYLPYELKGITYGYDKDKRTSTLYGVSYDYYFETEVIIQTKLSNITSTDKTRISEFQPILRPLSDLKKEIEVNGLNYSFEDWVFETSCPSEIDQYNKCIYEKLSDGASIKIHYLSYRIIEKLLEWHFDIFGLIENNLAIDINTL